MIPKLGTSSERASLFIQKDMQDNQRIYGFPPVCGENPRILILGSMPSVKSLEEAQYYAHPRNAFWRIQAALFDEPFTTNYEERKRRLMHHGIALWDSAASCIREGSMDSAITEAVPTDVPALLAAHPSIGHIFFNGGASQKLFLRFHRSLKGQISTTLLPSTSPAAAVLTLEQKTERWRCILDALSDTRG